MPTKNVTVIVGTTYVPASTSIENVLTSSSTSQYTDTAETQESVDVRNTTSVLPVDPTTSLISSIIPVESTTSALHNHSTDGMAGMLSSSTFVYTTSSLSSVYTPVLIPPSSTLVASTTQILTLPLSTSSSTRETTTTSTSSSIPVTQSTVLVTKTVSQEASTRSSSTTSTAPSVITQTLTVTPTTLALPFSVSSGSTRDYLIYTQEYLFTDDTTSFSTGLPQTTTLKKSASGIVLPTAVVTKPVSYYKAYLDGSLDGSSTSTGTSTQHHKNVIIGSVVGTVLGVAACVCLGVLYYMFVVRRRRQANSGEKQGQFRQGGVALGEKKEFGDPFDSEFQFHERVPGQIPVLPLDGGAADSSEAGDDSSLQDSFDLAYDATSSVRSADFTYQASPSSYQFPYPNSDDYSYTRSVRNWDAQS